MTYRKKFSDFVESIKQLVPGVLIVAVLLLILALMGGVPEMYQGARGR